MKDVLGLECVLATMWKRSSSRERSFRERERENWYLSERKRGEKGEREQSIPVTWRLYDKIDEESM